MVIMAYLLRPWIMKMRKLNLKARVLADDVMLMAIGNDSLDSFKQGFQQTLDYFEDIGAKVSEKKSFLFSTNRKVRQELRGLSWTQIKSPLKVVNDARDLGSHINFSCRVVGTTLNRRVEDATRTMRKVQWLPFCKKTKARVARTAVLTKAFYGCEAAPISEALLRKLQTAIAKGIGSPKDRASNALTFLLNSGGGRFRSRSRHLRETQPHAQEDGLQACRRQAKGRTHHRSLC